jgi:hypothetical protein
MNASNETPQGEPLFGTLVMMLSTTALHHLGHGAEPGSQPAVDLRGAEAMIDLLEMIERKTKGNRTADESRMLTAALTELRMAFVRATSEAPAAAEDAAEPAPEPSVPEPAEDREAKAADDGAPPKGDEGREPRYHKTYG